MKNLIRLVILLALFNSACNSEKKETPDEDPSTTTNVVLKDENSNQSFSYVQGDAAYLTSESECNQILQQGIMQEFKFTSKKEYVQSIQNAITMSDEEIRKRESENDTNLDIGYKLITLGFGSSSSDKEYNEIRKKYVNNSKIDISDKDLITIESRIADPNIVKAWSECISSRKGILYKINGDQSKEFTIQIQYVPQPLQPNKIKVTNFTTSGSIEAIGSIVFKPGLKLNSNQSFTQKFKRKTPGIGTLSIDSKLNPVNIYIPALVRRKPDSTVVWTSTDEHGNKYSQVYVTGLPECHDCRDRPGIEVSKIERLDNPNGRIYQVVRKCIGECSWNYSKAPDGRADFLEIQPDKRSFYWQRFNQGPACTEQYTAYYEVQKKVPVIKLNN